jgi:hypothetical protein
LRQLSRCPEINLLISAHYHAPQPLTSRHLLQRADQLLEAPWAPSEASWHTLATIDQTLLDLKAVPPR